MKFSLRLSVLCILATLISAPTHAGTYEEELRSLSSSLGASLEKAGLKTIAIGTFRDTKGKEPALGTLLTEELSVELVNQHQGVSVVDRANLNRLLEEHKLTEEGLIDPENARKLKLEGIDAIILGTIIPFENAYRVSLKAIATDSARIVAATRGNINESDSLNALMGLSRPKSVPVASVEERTPRPAQNPNPQTVKKTPMNFGRVRAGLESVTFNQKNGRVLVTFFVASKFTGDSFSYRLIDKNNGGTDPRFTRGHRNKKSPFQISDFTIDGTARDDKGNLYKLLTPSDAGSIASLSRDQPINFQLEFQVVPAADGRIQLPETISFWFNFYAGIVQRFDAEGQALRFSVTDYPFDRVF